MFMKKKTPFPLIVHTVQWFGVRERHSQSKLAIQNSLECRLVGNNPHKLRENENVCLLAATATLCGQQTASNSAVSG